MALRETLTVKPIIRALLPVALLACAAAHAAGIPLTPRAAAYFEAAGPVA